MIGQARRTLALLDVENLLYGEPSAATAGDYTDAVLRAGAAAGLTHSAQVVVGVGSGNPVAAFATLDAWPGAALRCRRGANGADRALGDQLADLQAVGRSFDAVVIGSGDHYFLDHVVALNEVGVHTTVVSWSRKMSRRLQLAASAVKLLDEPETTTSVVRVALPLLAKSS